MKTTKSNPSPASFVPVTTEDVACVLQNALRTVWESEEMCWVTADGSSIMECGTCGCSASSREDVKHDSGCIQGVVYEALRLTPTLPVNVLGGKLPADLPWQTDCLPPGNHRIIRGGGVGVVASGLTKKHAAFIVNACNSHAAHLAKIQRLEDALQRSITAHLQTLCVVKHFQGERDPKLQRAFAETHPEIVAARAALA
jgi:hypothetical protein